MFTVHLAHTTEDLDGILQLRYKILREPWQQPITTATDDLEATSINAFIKNEKGVVIACGRLQENENKTGQIRFMAVDDDQQGKGLGKLIVVFLEEKAKDLGLEKIELQARENAVDFYKSCGYSVQEKSFLLWGQIQHFLMAKRF
ncbi:MAG: GNAT family N-acetyltransferase [Bacteroidota bacterium]